MEKHGDNGHGMDHIDSVFGHGMKALSCEPFTDYYWYSEPILLACLLHEVDDRKLFKTQDYSNARSILKEVGTVDIDKVIELIDLVSASKNQNKTVEEKWKLIPRDCDRIEAMGLIGVKRAYQYTMKIGGLLYTDKTPRAATLEAVYKIATPERFANYKGDSESMIDHYYDKLLHIGHIASGNKYLLHESKERMKAIEAVVLAFGQTGEVNETWLKSL